MESRYAIYFAPPDHSPLDQFGRLLLHRSATQADSTGWPEERVLWPCERHQWRQLTHKARGYGFHATLKAPFELAKGYHEQDLVNELILFCQHQEPIALAGLAPRVYDHFLSLALAEPITQLDHLAGDIVEYFEPFRAPLREHDRQRREPTRLSSRQNFNLERYGYPFIFEDFRFHMTLSKRQRDLLDHVDLALVSDWYRQQVCEVPVLDRLSVFRQPSRLQPFVRIAEIGFSGAFGEQRRAG